ncbi:MAG: 2-oxoacid:acceptor oxidoreductase family protein [Patescibacteria group bacterium]|jgi:pyruvate ferredoxin oxidoreductase gamma subunit
MEQIRVHGRGGQGVVTAAELIAIAAFYSGREAQSFPNFGVERSGAPIQSYARVSHRPILTREQVYAPTVLLIQDPTLVDEALKKKNALTQGIFAGCTPDTKIIINAPANRWPSLKKKFKNLYFSPATEIALEIFGKNIVNTVILGALAKYTKIISLPALEKAIKEKFADKGKEIIKKNILAVDKAGR